MKFGLIAVALLLSLRLIGLAAKNGEQSCSVQIEVTAKDGLGAKRHTIRIPKATVQLKAVHSEQQVLKSITGQAGTVSGKADPGRYILIVDSIGFREYKQEITVSCLQKHASFLSVELQVPNDALQVPVR